MMSVRTGPARRRSHRCGSPHRQTRPRTLL